MLPLVVLLLFATEPPTERKHQSKRNTNAFHKIPELTNAAGTSKEFRKSEYQVIKPALPSLPFVNLAGQMKTGRRRNLVDLTGACSFHRRL